jgi:hypothetical protein
MNLSSHSPTLLISSVLTRLHAAMGWRVRGSNPGGGKTFRTHPDQHWGPPTTSFPGVKQPVHGIDHPLPSRAEVKERVLLPPMGLQGQF